MDKNVELVKNTFIIFIGKFCTQFISFLLVPLYTKNLTTLDYGYIDLVKTYMSLLIPIIILRLDSAVFRFILDERKNENNKKNIITSTIILIFIQIISFIIIVLIFNIFLQINYIVLIVLDIVFMALSSIILQISRGIGDNIGYSIASILSAIITIILNLIFIIGFKMSGFSIFIASTISNMICSVFLIVRNKLYKYFNIKYFSKQQLKSMLKYSLPMIPDGLSWWIVNASDRTIISFLINMSANGIYAISSKFSNILSNILLIFNMSWQESASLHVKDRDRDEFFSNIFNTTYKLFFSICIVLISSMHFIFLIMVGSDYQNAIRYVPILLLGNLFNAMANVIGGVYIANKDTKSCAKTTMLGSIINILINVLLVRKIGLWAAAISTMISYLALTIYRYIDVQKYSKMKISTSIFIKTAIILSIIVLLFYINNPIINILNLLFGILIACLLNKNILKNLFSIFFKKIKFNKFK